MNSTLSYAICLLFGVGNGTLEYRDRGVNTNRAGIQNPGSNCIRIILKNIITIK